MSAKFRSDTIAIMRAAGGILFLILNISLATAFITCGGNCTTNADCQSYLGNPCTFCEEGQCSPMCGVGCSTSADCAGGGNPCTQCSNRRVCINPVPQCGSFCGGFNGACQFNTGQCAGALEQCCTCNPGNYSLGCGNYTTSPVTCGTKCVSSSDCSKATNGCVYCVNNACTSQSSLCGTICSGSGQCQSDAKCTQCVGYYCSQPTSCGQNCISSGQCQSNPGSCKACIGTLCANYEPCGGACGSDDWCDPHSSCPVCNHVAKCASSFEHEQWLQTATKEDLAEWKFKMEWVTEQANNAAHRKYMRLLKNVNVDNEKQDNNF